MKTVTVQARTWDRGDPLHLPLACHPQELTLTYEEATKHVGIVEFPDMGFKYQPKQQAAYANYGWVVKGGDRRHGRTDIPGSVLGPALEELTRIEKPEKKK